MPVHAQTVTPDAPQVPGLAPVTPLPKLSDSPTTSPPTTTITPGGAVIPSQDSTTPTQPPLNTTRPSASSLPASRPATSRPTIQPVANSGMFWAEGITRVTDLDLYAKCGLNTVVVRVPWRPTPDGSITPADLQPVRAFAEAAAAKGLDVIYALPATPQGLENGLRVSADGQAYFALWEAWANAVIKGFKDTPRLVGWMLPDDPRGFRYADDAAFAHWLGTNYANPTVLNNQWNSNYRSLDAISLDNVDRLAQRFRRGTPMAGEFTQDEMNEAFDQAKAPNPAITLSWAYHPASLVTAQFYQDLWRALVGGWASRIRSADPLHPLFSGRLPDYAQMLALPALRGTGSSGVYSTEDAGIDVSVPDARPSVTEHDVLTHNPQAVTIARRGGRMRAVPTIQTEEGSTVSSAQIPRLMPGWIEAQWSRGASGLAFSSWSQIARDADLQKAISGEITKLNAPPFAGSWGRAPVSTSALVLTPLADAYQVQIEGAPRGLYGFGKDLVNGEPGDLVWALRWGTAFGSVDILSPDDVMSGALPLNRYNTLLMPDALSLPDEEARALYAYVQRGGVMITDLGVGSLQTGGGVTALSPELRGLLGIVPDPNAQILGRNLGLTGVTRPWSGNLRLLNAHPLLPTFSGTPDRGNRGAQLTSGDGPNNTAFSGASASFVPQTAQPIAQATGNPRAMLTLNSVGNGFAGFAPFPLWSNWRPGSAGFDAFHGDLFSRGSAAVIANVTSFVPAAPGSPVPSYPELLNFPNAVALFNHAPMQQACVVQTSGVGRFLWSDCINSFGDTDNTLVGGRPAPIANATDYEREAHPASLYAYPQGNSLMMMRLRPVRVFNLNGGAICAQIARETSRSLEMLLWPNTSAPTATANGWTVSSTEGGNGQVQLFDAPEGYRLAPNSRHRVTITELATNAAPVAAKNKKDPAQPVSGVRTFDLQADARGMIQFYASGKVLSIKIAPL